MGSLLLAVKGPSRMDKVTASNMIRGKEDRAQEWVSCLPHTLQSTFSLKGLLYALYLSHWYSTCSTVSAPDRIQSQSPLSTNSNVCSLVRNDPYSNSICVEQQFGREEPLGESVIGRVHLSFLPFLYQPVIYLLPDSCSAILILIIVLCYVVFSYNI